MRQFMRLGRTTGTLSILLATSAVSAQSTDQAPAPSPAEPGEAQGKMSFAVPEATAPVPRSYHMHDGFYARVGPGIGWVGSDWSMTSPTLASGDTQAGGTSLALDLMVGGSPSRGVAVGGALLSHLMLATDVSSGDEDLGSGDLNLLLVGPFIDGFPSPTQGWHFGGTVGLARAHLKVQSQTVTGWGLGGAAWAGYDAWVGDEWSVGGMGRFMLTRTGGESDVFSDISATATTFTLSFTALYN